MNGLKQRFLIWKNKIMRSKWSVLIALIAAGIAWYVIVALARTSSYRSTDTTVYQSSSADWVTTFLAQLSWKTFWADEATRTSLIKFVLEGSKKKVEGDKDKGKPSDIKDTTD